MASTNVNVYNSPFGLNASNNSFVTPWLDKRSGSVIGLSLIFYGDATPDGYAWVECSNATDQVGSGFGQPNNQGDDSAVYPNSQQNIVINSQTGLYGCQWQISSLGAHFVRVRYTAAGSSAGLSVNCYFSAPRESP